MKKLGCIIGGFASAIPFMWFSSRIEFSIQNILILLICQTLYIIGVELITQYKVSCNDDRCVYNFKGRCRYSNVKLNKERKCETFNAK